MRAYNLKLPGEEGRLYVEADVGFDLRRGGFYVEDTVFIDGDKANFRMLPPRTRRWLLQDLRHADMILRDVGKLDCDHGRYLVREHCVDCLAAARSTP